MQNEENKSPQAIAACAGCIVYGMVDANIVEFPQYKSYDGAANLVRQFADLQRKIRMLDVELSAVQAGQSKVFTYMPS
ncbi:MAG TPA: hypothetical protein PKU80_12825 [Candidatus Limiplasma sp.]|mgnify:FL=1|nr:hypothetical protein [Candidatus Limiplasma sp.]